MNDVTYLLNCVTFPSWDLPTFTGYLNSNTTVKKANTGSAAIDKTDHLDGSNTPTIHTELPKSKAHIIVEIIEYVPNAVVSKTIIKKTTGNITVSSFDAGEELGEKTIAFDNYIQIIDGAAEVTIDKKKYMLRLGEGMIIPAHSSHCFNANEQFKMISTIIKSGYE